MHPILLKLGPLTLYTYGFFLALGFLTTIYLAGREARRQGLSAQKIYDLCFWAIIGALVGSRLLYVVLEPDYFLAHPLDIFALWKGGLVFHGGLIGALAAAFFCIWRYSLPWRNTLDCLAFGMPVGQALGRVGCFMAGCCYGQPSSLPWAVSFKGVPGSLCPFPEALHPAQLYEAAILLGVFGIIYGLRTRTRFAGQLTLSYFFLAGWTRFGVEFFRHPGDYRGPVYWGMPLTQLTALIIALLSGAVLLYAWLAARRKEG